MDEWQFNLVLSNPNGNVPEFKAENLMDTIHTWAEENGYAIGGGYGPVQEPGTTKT